MAEKSRFKKFWDFDFFILPIIIKVLMIVWMIACIVWAIAMRVKWENFWEWLGILILGPIGVRIYTEIFILVFKIAEDIKKIANKK